MTVTETDSTLRLVALHASALLDSPAEPAFDRITRLAHAALHVPVALISLVDRDRQFFKSQCGLPVEHADTRQTPLSQSFCQHVVNTQAPLLVRDTRQHDLLKDDSAIRALNVVAYAGVPIRDSDGYVLGSLCALDTRPRDWTDADVEVLSALSAQVTLEIQLRRKTLELTESIDRHRRDSDERLTMARLTVHDLRTPMSAMLMGMEVMQHLGPLNKQQRDYLALCKRNGNAMLSMVDSLLDISSVEQHGSLALARLAMPPADIVDQALEQVLPLIADKKLIFNSDVCQTLPMIFADVDKLVRTLVNLLANAIKFTDAGGHIRLTARMDHEGTGEFVEFSVSDTGSGIAEPEHIFEEGVRLDRFGATRRSTGLGLTFCKRIIDAHGGRIWFETEVGAGSTFHITVPTNRPST